MRFKNNCLTLRDRSKRNRNELHKLTCKIWSNFFSNECMNSSNRKRKNMRINSSRKKRFKQSKSKSGTSSTSFKSVSPQVRMRKPYSEPNICAATPALHVKKAFKTSVVSKSPSCHGARCHTVTHKNESLELGKASQE